MSPAHDHRELLQTIFDHIPVMIDCIDPSGRFITVNREWERVLGWSLEEVQGRDMLPEFYPDPDDRRRVCELIEEASSFWQDCRVRVRDGRTLETTWANVRLSDGTRIGIGQDITARKRAEQALHDSEERFRVVLKNSPICVFTQDRDLRYTWFHNAPAPRTPDEIIGRLDSDILLPEEAERVTSIKRTVLETGVGTRVELAITTSKGVRSFDLTVEPLRSSSGEVIGITCAATDITEHRRLEEGLRQAQKMEAIGRLAGGIAHDFNNILTVILGNAGLMSTILRRDQMGFHELGTHLEQIDLAAQRAAALTRQLLAFARGERATGVVLDLNAVLRHMEPMLRRLIGEDIRLRLRLASDLPPIRADLSRIEQVILNLIVNARDAMPNGGKVLVRTATSRAPNAGGSENQSIAPRVILKVTDSGVGMNRQVLDRIFEPFFTTKAPGKGTGLGLSTVYTIIKQAGGQVSVTSRPGRGATFTIELPASDEPAMPEPIRHSEDDRRSDATVLICEDEPMVRSLAVRVLESGGCKVIAAGSSAEATELARDSGRLDLLVTDVILPDQNGLILAENLKQAYPGLKVLFISGYTDDILSSRGVSSEQVELLDKPFLADELLRRVRLLLGD